MNISVANFVKSRILAHFNFDPSFYVKLTHFILNHIVNYVDASRNIFQHCLTVFYVILEMFLYSNRICISSFAYLLFRCPIFNILAFMNYNIYDMSFPSIVYLLTYRQKFVKLILRAYCKKGEIALT